MSFLCGKKYLLITKKQTHRLFINLLLFAYVLHHNSPKRLCPGLLSLSCPHLPGWAPFLGPPLVLVWCTVPPSSRTWEYNNFMCFSQPIYMPILEWSLKTSEGRLTPLFTTQVGIRMLIPVPAWEACGLMRVSRHIDIWWKKMHSKEELHLLHSGMQKTRMDQLGRNILAFERWEVFFHSSLEGLSSYQQEAYKSCVCRSPQFHQKGQCEKLHFWSKCTHEGQGLS